MRNNNNEGISEPILESFLIELLKSIENHSRFNENLLFYGIDTSNAKTKLGGTRSSGEVIHHFRYFWVLLWVEITQIFENFQNFKISICDRYTRRKVCSKIYLESESQGERILTLSRKSEHFSKQSKVGHTSLIYRSA